MNAPPVPPRRLGLLVAGFGIWCSALVVLYALHAIGCAFAWPTGALRWSLVVTLLIHLALLGWLWRNQVARASDPDLGATASFIRWVIVACVICAIAATLFVLVPPLLLTTCL